MKILIVSSVGGHLSEIMRLEPLLRGHEVSLVLNDEARLPDFPFARVYRIAHAERDLRVLLNIAEAARILLSERPDMLLSAGAGPLIPFALLCRAIGGVRVVFVETAAAVEALTLTGRLMTRLAHDYFFQWPALARHVPRGRLAPIVFG